jgi:hypothetical protein
MPDRILMKSSSVNAWSARERTAAGVVVSAFVKRDDKTLRHVVENDDGVLHIASERQLQLAMPKRS